MKNKKVIDFHFIGNSKEDMKNLLNEELPISIKNIAYIVDRIYDKYPVIDKDQIALIVRAVFESIRDFLILGYIVNLRRFMLDMKLSFFTHVRDGKTNPAVSLRVKAPKILEK